MRHRSQCVRASFKHICLYVGGVLVGIICIEGWNYGAECELRPVSSVTRSLAGGK